MKGGRTGMEIAIYQVDAFASEVFSGNPAAVCVLDGWIEDRILLGIAAENNLSETAFLVAGNGGFDLRWFTPKVEVALCGHATLAAAKVMFDVRGWSGERIRFRTRWKGELAVERRGEWFEMDFPAMAARPVKTPEGLGEALGAEPLQVLASEEDWLAAMEDEATVRGLAPDFRALERYECRCIVPTARGEAADFVSRAFAPRLGIDEDPATGSSHCVLAPYWGAELGKAELLARQVSARGGEIRCRNEGGRVKLSGRAALYMEGRIRV